MQNFYFAIPPPQKSQKIQNFTYLPLKVGLIRFRVVIISQNRSSKGILIFYFTKIVILPFPPPLKIKKNRKLTLKPPKIIFDSLQHWYTLLRIAWGILESYLYYGKSFCLPPPKKFIAPPPFFSTCIVWYLVLNIFGHPLHWFRNKSVISTTLKFRKNAEFYFKTPQKLLFCSLI